MSDVKPLLSLLQKEKIGRIPFWFMRQAGRYLPEYRELRSRHKNFLEFCYTPKAASEATLQPIRRFGMDGAIIFSDILVIPQALGQEVRFEEGRGPILNPLRTQKELDKLTPGNITKFLAPVYEALRLTRKALPGETALIGFVGAPWTIACYMIEGGSSKEFSHIKHIAEKDKEFFSRLIDVLTNAIIEHAKNQIQAGAEIVQIFDSWAGLAQGALYHEWIINPTRTIVNAVKQEYPLVPVIGFPRQSGENFLTYVEETGVDAVSFDDTVSLPWVVEYLCPQVVVQGGISPVVLAGDKEVMLSEAKKVISMLENKSFVFNLSHGILPHTPVENMQALCDYLKNAHLP